jgi:hypothetical protein
VGDILLRRELALNTIGLTADGLVIADSIHREICNALTTVRDEATRPGGDGQAQTTTADKISGSPPNPSADGTSSAYPAPRPRLRCRRYAGHRARRAGQQRRASAGNP